MINYCRTVSYIIEKETRTESCYNRAAVPLYRLLTADAGRDKKGGGIHRKKSCFRT